MFILGLVAMHVEFKTVDYVVLAFTLIVLDHLSLPHQFHLHLHLQLLHPQDPAAVVEPAILIQDVTTQALILMVD